MADKEDLERSRKDEEISSKDGTLPDPKNPAERDSLNFEETEWVSFWKKWQRRSPVDDLTELVQTSNFQGGLENFSSLSPMSVHDWGLSKEGSTKYWSYHLLRSGFFVAQAAAGLAVSRTREETADTMGYLTTNTGLRLYTEALQMFRQDFSNIKAGYYKVRKEAALKKH